MTEIEKVSAAAEFSVGQAVMTRQGRGIITRKKSGNFEVQLDKKCHRGRVWLQYFGRDEISLIEEAVANPTPVPVPEPAPMPPASKKTRAPGAGRPPLNPPTERVWGRIPADLLPELERRGGAAQVLIDALTRSAPKK